MFSKCGKEQIAFFKANAFEKQMSYSKLVKYKIGRTANFGKSQCRLEMFSNVEDKKETSLWCDLPWSEKERKTFMCHTWIVEKAHESPTESSGSVATKVWGNVSMEILTVLPKLEEVSQAGRAERMQRPFINAGMGHKRDRASLNDIWAT